MLSLPLLSSPSIFMPPNQSQTTGKASELFLVAFRDDHNEMYGFQSVTVSYEKVADGEEESALEEIDANGNGEGMEGFAVDGAGGSTWR